ncbi:MAG: hypothetical protein KJ058_10295 [Thermoanaerobaculia bacterium]|nr:hypothetical protein [Thermoanaerobaculia bacterium]
MASILSDPGEGLEETMDGAAKMARKLARALLLAALLLPAAAGAELLVFRGGDDFVRTEGPWEERGGRLVFRSPGGRLFSVALAEVDLPRSREITARLAREGPAALAGLVPAGPVADERELAVADIPDALKHRGETVEESVREERRSGEPTARRDSRPRRPPERALPKLRRVVPADRPEPGGGQPPPPRPRRR